MAVKIINTAGTFNIKQGTGRLYSIFCVSVGTAFTIAVNDGADSNGNVQSLLPTTTPPGVGHLLNPNQQPIVFRDGLQIVTGGTPGSYQITFD